MKHVTRSLALATVFALLAFGCSEEPELLQAPSSDPLVSPGTAPPGKRFEVSSLDCAQVQYEVQMAVGDEDPMVYRNHGEYMSTVAHIVDQYVQAGAITGQCGGCIKNQFARRIPIAEQMPCFAAGLERNLNGPQVIACDGSPVGTVTVTDLGGLGLKVRVEFMNGPANASEPVYWVCTSVANGCHDEACGYITLGNIMTDGDGHGVFETTLAGGNPYAGQYVHFDVGSLVFYTSLWDVIFPSVVYSTASYNSSAGDPTQ